jgi:hypothetical protein
MVYDVMRKRKIRGGRLGYRPPVRLTPAAQRRRDRQRAQELAKSEFPVLEAKLDRISEKLRAARMSGKRFAYKVPLKNLYTLAYDWDQKGKLQARIGKVAALRAIALRAKANPFNVLVRAVLGVSAERKVVSRWSVPLTKALNKGVSPKALGKHI